MKMKGKLILSNRTVNIKNTMKPCLCNDGVTVCVGHQDKLSQIAEAWNNHDDLTEENARLRGLAESMLNMNMELINDHNKRVPPWDFIDMEHIHDGFKLLKGDEDE